MNECCGVVPHEGRSLAVSMGPEDQYETLASGTFREDSVSVPPQLISNTSTNIALCGANMLALSHIKTLETIPKSPPEPFHAVSTITVSEIQPSLPQTLVVALKPFTTVKTNFSSPEMPTEIYSRSQIPHSGFRPQLMPPRAMEEPVISTSENSNPLMATQSIFWYIPATQSSIPKVCGSPQFGATGTEALLGSSGKPISITDDLEDDSQEKASTKIKSESNTEVSRDDNSVCRRSKRSTLHPQQTGIPWRDVEYGMWNKLANACQTHIKYWDEAAVCQTPKTKTDIQKHCQKVQDLVTATQNKDLAALDLTAVRESNIVLCGHIVPDGKENYHLTDKLHQSLSEMSNAECELRVLLDQWEPYNDMRDGAYMPRKRRRRS